MLVAAIGGIHGNLPALDATLEAIDEQGVLTIFCTGNLAIGYPWPAEIVDRLIGRRAIVVKGDTDHVAARILRMGDVKKRKLGILAEAAEWTYENITTPAIEFLGDLPLIQERTLEDNALCVFHGTPTNVTEVLTQDEDDMRYARIRERLLADAAFISGHAPPFHRNIAGTHFINPGNVGLVASPNATASYAILNTEESPWQVEFHEVPYDAALAEARREACGLPHPGDYLN